MTDAMPVICRRCGFGNVPGDQFCGSCGAFLEWEGEPAQGHGAPTGAPPTGSAPDAGDATTVIWTPPPVTPAAEWTPPAPAAPAPAPVAAEPGLLRCPACGIANAATRTFCQSCGATLAAATRLAEPSAAQIAAAVEAVPGRAATSPVPPAPPGMVSGEADQRTSRGLPGWVLALVAAGVVVGVIVVGASQLLKGEKPSTGASAAPSLGLASGSPGTGESASPGDSAAPGQTAAPAKAAALDLTGAAASSVVGNRAKFQPEKAIDGDLATAWQEGNATEKGQWIEVTFGPSRVDSVVIRNGYQASNALFAGNRRLKDVLISVNGGEPVKVRLKDSTKAQTIDLGGVADATSVRITIVNTYAAKKTSVSGTPFDDAALSEIRVIGVAGG